MKFRKTGAIDYFESYKQVQSMEDECKSPVFRFETTETKTLPLILPRKSNGRA